VATVMHYNSSLPDVAPVVVGFNYEAHFTTSFWFDEPDFLSDTYFWRLVGIFYQYFSHIFTLHAQKLLFPNFR